MTKFILIDQSIKDAGGHHLEYALRVLKAAKLIGFKTVLAVNKSCCNINNAHIDVVDKAFSYSFWENFQSESAAITPRERRYLKTIKSKIDYMLYILSCSSLGFAYIAFSQGVGIIEVFRRYGTATAGKRLSALTILAAFVLSNSYKASKLLFKRLRLNSAFTRSTGKVFFYLFTSVLALILSPVLLPYLSFRWMRVLGLHDAFASCFADDLQQLLIRVDAHDGDIIFIPTLGNVELVGSGMCTERFPVAQLNWHFLFRRNIFIGREPTYQNQIEAQLKTLQAFSAFKQMQKHTTACFYTDTEALTEQYNRLGVFDFKTLPIPLDDTLHHIEARNSFLTIAYIGDARDEKGFPLLSRLVSDLRAAGYSSQDIKFVFQSNFNITGGEAGSRVARAELNLEPSDWVTLVEGPFESNEYTDLINSSDILLIPYESNNYYARSSGIFAEALAAGIPIVASDKSWMSQELLSINQQYYNDIFRTNKPLQTLTFDEESIKSKFVFKPYSKGKYSWLLIEVKQLFEKPGSFLHIRWKSSPEYILKADRISNLFRNYTIDLRQTTAYSLLRLPVREQLILELKLDDGSGSMQKLGNGISAGLSIGGYELDLAENTPLFNVGALYCVEEDLVAASIEVIDAHEQYLKHGAKCKNKWSEFHSAETLVKMLEGA